MRVGLYVGGHPDSSIFKDLWNLAHVVTTAPRVQLFLRYAGAHLSIVLLSSYSRPMLCHGGRTAGDDSPLHATKVSISAHAQVSHTSQKQERKWSGFDRAIFLISPHMRTSSHIKLLYAPTTSSRRHVAISASDHLIPYSFNP